MKQAFTKAGDALRLIETHNLLCDYVTTRAACMPVWANAAKTEEAVEALRRSGAILVEQAKAAGINAAMDADGVLPDIRLEGIR